MLSLEEMVLRFIIALAVGCLIGLEREYIGKEAGIRTSMLVSGGAALFSLIALSLPYLVALSPEGVSDIIARNSGFLSVIANVVVGIGFLGAGIIMKHENRVHGLTTAAVIWATAGVGILIGIGLLWFGVIAGFLITVLLFLLKGIRIHPITPTEK
ncbi:MAG: MgtC/SapB family protein [Candidatus Paceibacterota bacterium]